MSRFRLRPVPMLSTCCGPCCGSLRSSERGVDLSACSLAAGRLQVAHRALHVGVTEPLLHGTQINTSPQMPCCERRPELVKPEVFLLEFRPLGARFQTIEEI